MLAHMQQYRLQRRLLPVTVRGSRLLGPVVVVVGTLGL
jgi:hypothetical protein